MAGCHRVGNSEHQNAGVLQANMVQHLLARCVPIDNRLSLIARFPNRFGVQLHYEIRNASSAKHLRQVTPVESIADYDNVPTHVRSLGVESGDRWLKQGSRREQRLQSVAEAWRRLKIGR